MLRLIFLLEEAWYPNCIFVLFPWGDEGEEASFNMLWIFKHYQHDLLFAVHDEQSLAVEIQPLTEKCNSGLRSHELC